MTTITITGAECTGKTTLVRALAARYGVPWVPEAARLFVERVGRSVRRDDVAGIAALHLELASSVPCSRFVLFDTDLLSTVAYARHYFGSCPRAVSREAERRAADFYVVSAVDLPWEDDVRQRGSVEGRLPVQRRIAGLVASSGRPWVEVRGSGPARLETAAAAIDRFLGSLQVQPGPGNAAGRRA